MSLWTFLGHYHETPKESFLGPYKKIHLPSAYDMCALICKAGWWCFLYSADVTSTYRQLPLDPTDWPLVCFGFNGSFYTDVSLPCGLRWAASHCQDVTSLITQELARQGSTVLSYIDNFGGIAQTQLTAATHSEHLQDLLARLGLQETKHKATSPSHVMVWLDLQFDSVTMMVTLPPDKHMEVTDLVNTWSLKMTTNLHYPHTLQGKLLYVAQVCSLACLFLNQMLDTLMQCPTKGSCTLSPEFRKTWPGSTQHRWHLHDSQGHQNPGTSVH